MNRINPDDLPWAERRSPTGTFHHVPAKAWHYPDSDKWGIRGVGIFRRTPAEYYDGEEERPAMS